MWMNVDFDMDMAVGRVRFGFISSPRALVCVRYLGGLSPRACFRIWMVKGCGRCPVFDLDFVDVHVKGGIRNQ